MYRKATLRRLPPRTRDIARLINAAESVARRLKNQLPHIERLELDAKALWNMEALHKQEAPKDQPVLPVFPEE